MKNDDLKYLKCKSDLSVARTMSDVFEFSAITQQGSNAVKAIVLRTIGSRKYNAAKIADMTDEISASSVEKLREIAPNFKVIVSCLVIQKKGAGVHLESATHWDVKADGSFVVKEENESMICIVTVFGLAI